ERVFANPDVTVASLADVLDVAPSRLSQLLNDNMGVSFATLINARRVDEAKRLIETAPHLTMEAVGYEAGFRSKSAFYSAFKRQTGATPASFRSHSEAPES
ncbi:MAG: helix-turn-helix transcriptional regulator, partial [Bacteroidota bacterium]